MNPKYYREFWNRRIDEGNDSMAYVIVKEINQAIKGETKQILENEFVNDTLYNLLLVQYKSEPLTKGMTLDIFKRLKKFGFHQSAYNLLFTYTRSNKIECNKDSLEKTLVQVKVYTVPWFIYDQGP